VTNEHKNRKDPNMTKNVNLLKMQSPPKYVGLIYTYAPPHNQQCTPSKRFWSNEWAMGLIDLHGPEKHPSLRSLSIALTLTLSRAYAYTRDCTPRGYKIGLQPLAKMIHIAYYTYCIVPSLPPRRRSRV